MVGAFPVPLRAGGPLGTPSSGVLTNATGLPLTTGVTGVLPIANGGTNKSSLPNFSAYRTTSAQTLTGALAEVVFNAEVWDVGSGFDTGTGRWTPGVAGKVRINATITTTAVGGSTGQVIFYALRNGTFDDDNAFVLFSDQSIGVGTQRSLSGSAVIEVDNNDYISIWGITEFNSIDLPATKRQTFFQGELLPNP